MIWLMIETWWIRMVGNSCHVFSSYSFILEGKVNLRVLIERMQYLVETIHRPPTDMFRNFIKIGAEKLLRHRRRQQAGTSWRFSIEILTSASRVISSHPRKILAISSTVHPIGWYYGQDSWQDNGLLQNITFWNLGKNSTEIANERDNWTTQLKGSPSARRLTYDRWESKNPLEIKISGLDNEMNWREMRTILIS